MKSEIITEPGKTATKRWYDDACGTALAMELVGERWSLLIVRELMFGPRRFGELRGGLPGISANVLTQRLEGLETAGILARRRLPSPANVQVYELTPWGYESEEPIKVLGRWAVRSPAHDPTLPLSAASLMMSFRTMYDPAALVGGTLVIGFRLGADQFVVTLSASGVDIVRDEPTGVDLLIAAPPTVIAGLVYGGAPADALVGAGLLTMTGDGLDRFRGCFQLPEKIARVDGAAPPSH